MTGAFKVDPSYDLKAFWTHSFRVASICRLLTRQWGLDPNIAFTYGMMHNIGELLIQSGTSEFAARLNRQPRKRRHWPRGEPLRDKKTLKHYPLGYSHIDITEVHNAEERAYLFVAIDRMSKFVYAELHKQRKRKDADNFLRLRLSRYPIRCILYPPTTEFNLLRRSVQKATGPILSMRSVTGMVRASANQALPSLDQWPS